MNFSLYLFGNPEGKYSQIPDDYLVSDIAAFQKDLKGSRLVIMRKMDLMHYVYWERINTNRYIGICLIFNRAYVAHPKQLVALFRDLIEDYLIKKGDIIRYSKEGLIQYVIKSFGDNPLRRQKIHEYITEKFENASAQYGISELKSTFNGEHTSRVVNFATEEQQIVTMAASYNTLIVDDTEGIEHGYIPQIIEELRDTINQLEEQNANLQAQNATLKRQKKQMIWILLLLLLLLLGGIGFYYYAQNKKQVIQDQSDEIAYLDSVIETKDSKIYSLNKYIKHLKTDSVNLSRALDNKKNQYEEVKEKLHDIHYELNNNVSAFTYFDAWRSTNYHQNTSTSTKNYSFYAHNGDELRIPYYVSSEYNYDFLTISLKRKGYSPTQLVRVSGSQSDTYTYRFYTTDSYELIVSYSKDDSGHGNNDNAGVTGMYLYRSMVDKLRTMSEYNE